ncbi:MAG: heavy metal translocating P-type ATPase [Syntrophobacteraceae bacterium]|nr:heavy metal translocating P-type ATPase [Syntrophobacteraceae bacterium]
MSYYVHEVPGRLRVKTPSAKGQAWVAQRIEEMVRAIPGVYAVNVNTTTGSIILNYDSTAVNSKGILSILEEKGLFDPSRALTGDQYLHSRMEKTGQVIGKAIFGLFLEKAFEGTPVALLGVLL